MEETKKQKISLDGMKLDEAKFQEFKKLMMQDAWYEVLPLVGAPIMMKRFYDHAEKSGFKASEEWARFEASWTNAKGITMGEKAMYYMQTAACFLFNFHTNKAVLKMYEAGRHS